MLAVLGSDAFSEDIHTTVEALRAEPMSLFDWGIFRLEEELQTVRRNDRDFIRIYYDPVRTQLVIEAVFLVERAEVVSIKAVQACFVRHHAIKLILGVIDTDRIHIAPAADFRLGMKFSHHNSDAYPGLPDAAALGARLMREVFIKVGIAIDPEQFPFAQIQRCDGALLSQDVDYHGVRTEDVLPE